VKNGKRLHHEGREEREAVGLEEAALPWRRRHIHAAFTCYPTLARRPFLLLHHGYMNIAGAGDDAKDVEQPQDDHNHHEGVDDGFDRILHRDQVDQPKYHADDDEGNDYIYERHAVKITAYAAGRYGV